jgi:hypothetical protein
LQTNKEFKLAFEDLFSLHSSNSHAILQSTPCRRLPSSKHILSRTTTLPDMPPKTPKKAANDTAGPDVVLTAKNVDALCAGLRSLENFDAKWPAVAQDIGITLPGNA